MKYIRLYVRLGLLVLFIAFFYLTVILFSQIISKKIWPYVLRFIAKGILFCSGGCVIRDATLCDAYITHNRMYISNHVSWLDVAVLSSVYSMSFVGRKEVKHWPILNSIVSSAGTIYIDRKKKSDVKRVNTILSKKLQQGLAIGLFPEGTTSDGTKLLPFKAPLLESTLMADSEVVPVVLEYFNKDGGRCLDVSYAGEITFWQTISNTLQMRGFTVKITQLPSIKATSFSSRDKLSDELYTQINKIVQK